MAGEKLILLIDASRNTTSNPLSFETAIAYKISNYFSNKRL